LAAYGYVASFLYRKMHRNVYTSLIGSMICGRIISGIAVWVLATLFAAQLPGPVIFITASVAKGLPGIVIQLIFIPAIVLLLEKYKVKMSGRNTIEA